MPADTERIRQLLDRYFEAETSAAEEQELRELFRTPPDDPELAAYAPLFADWREDERSVTAGPDLEARILDALQRETPVRRISPRVWMARAAAIALLLAGSWWAVREYNAREDRLALTRDTFEDPEEAFRQVEAALAMVSGAMQQGEDLTRESVRPTEGLDIILTQ